MGLSRIGARLDRKGEGVTRLVQPACGTWFTITLQQPTDHIRSWVLGVGYWLCAGGAAWWGPGMLDAGREVYLARRGIPQDDARVSSG